MAFTVGTRRTCERDILDCPRTIIEEESETDQVRRGYQYVYLGIGDGVFHFDQEHLRMVYGRFQG